MSEESFSQLSRSLGTFLSEMNAQDRDAASTNGQPTGLGNLGPVFTAQTTGVRSGLDRSPVEPNPREPSSGLAQILQLQMPKAK